ncbi:hypothetical protein, variant [Exophiala xenobiotica]|uniref:Peptidase M20 dimerisation domain-containing protein n=1 Tax=Exophiala xenobiotica TaxID=348802 RepID=A0A0D2EQB2_9EURO|nr:hypothetical protein, variant [Exophiala xenobiotica]KIW49944.1 hypothetical protein, variant [Exophiala xenobiotica]
MATTESIKQNSSSTPSDSTDSLCSVHVDLPNRDDSIGVNEPTSSSTSKSSKNPIHRINAPGSVQALVVDDDVLFVGVQGGSITAWSLETYELLATVPAHKESVLSLALSEDRSLLFSTGADSIVNVWSTDTLQRVYSLYSPFEIGDIFGVVHSIKKQTLFWGAQNASIQWQKISTDANITSPNLPFAPGSRKHRFFDSLGPGGAANVIADEDGTSLTLSSQGGRVLTAPSRNYLPYAHKSYIYCILLGKGLFNHDKDDEVLITASGDGAIKLWSIDALPSEGLVLLTKFKNTGSNVLSLSFRGSFLYAGLSDGTANIYNLASNQLVQRLSIGHGDVTQILVNTDSIFCGTSQGRLKRYNDHFTETECWQAANGKILAMSQTTTPGHDILITGGNDRLISFWDADAHSHTSIASSVRSNDELVNALREFVSYRTVALNHSCVRDCHDAVTFLRKQCNAFGATTDLVSAQEGINPILLAKFPASNPSKSTKTVLFYGHYDVVDAETDSSGANPTWQGDPFSLQPLNGYLYGRGVTDNKGPILAAIYAVADLVQQKTLSCNVTFLLEGDEEAGSRGFRQAVQAMHDSIGHVDFILLSNSYWLDDHIPCLTFGMRGVIHASVTVSSNRPDLHSGMDGKSVQHEPLKDLTILLASLIGPTGTKVSIPEFYDSVDDLSENEMKSYADITSALLPGHPEIKNEKAFALSLMQRWRFPNLTVHRIEVPEAKTAVTISGSAKAMLSIRIVPSQTAEQIAKSLTTYLQDQFTKLQSSNTLNVAITSKADPWLGNIKSDMYSALKEAVVDVWNPNTHSSHRFSPDTAATSAITDAASTNAPSPSASTTAKRSSHRRASSLASAGTFTSTNLPREPIFIREGGSIPAISFLEHEFHAPAAMFPMGQASDNAHLDNERIRVENLWKGRDVLKRVFSRL